MRSVLRSVRKRKKSRRLGAVAIINREEYAGFDVDAKVEMIRALVPLGLMHVQELLDDEVTALAGARHARKEPGVQGRRHGSNPGTVRLAGQRVPMRVPRVRSIAGGEIPLRSYEAAREDGQVNDVLLNGCSTASPAATTRRRLSRSPGRLACRAPRCLGVSSKPVRQRSGSFRSGTCPVRTSWPCSWTARPSPIRRWSSPSASRCQGRNASWASWRRTRRTRRFWRPSCVRWSTAVLMRRTGCS